MTLYKHKRFSVPATTPTKRPCSIHHFVKGKCLRCDAKVEKVVRVVTTSKPVNK